MNLIALRTPPSRGPGQRVALIATAMLLVFGAAACQTDLESEGGCPLLCPDEQIEVRQLDIDAVLLDSAVQGFPLRGEEGALLVAREGTTLDARAVYRFDAVPTRYAPLGADSVDITELVDAYLRVRIDTINSAVAAGSTLEVFDVDGSDVDNDVALLIPRFTADRLLGSVALPADFTTDTLQIPLNETRVLAAIQGSSRVRVGIRATAPTGRVTVLLSAVDAVLGVDPTADPNVGPLITTPLSQTPTNDETLRRSLTSFLLVAAGSPPLPSATLSAGGLPAWRSLLRFNIPAGILDSATIVRATLFLTQRPVPGTSLADSVTLSPIPVKASDAVVDVVQSILLSGNPAGAGGEAQVIRPLRLSPADSGQRLIELEALLSFWRASTVNRPQRAVVLRVEGEALTPGEVRFHSSESPASLRPRLRITYIPSLNLGIP